MNKLFVLGAPHLLRELDGIKREASLQPKLLALLTYLACAAPSGFVRRDVLLAMLWPDLDEAHARNALSQALFRLRRVTGSDSIVSRGAEELHTADSALWCDARAFDEAIHKGRAREAVELYRGSFLDALHVTGTANFSHWMMTERERYRIRTCEALEQLAEQDRAGVNLTGATRWLRRHLVLAPDDDSVLQRLMKALHKAGDRAGAVHAYQSFAQRLERDLDLRPSPQTEILLAKLRGTDSGAVPGAAIADASIAVLPFDNFSKDPDQDYLCDGLTEEIITALARTRGLRVAARKSLASFKGRTVDIPDLARRLQVSTILEGSVRCSGDRLRVTAQLIDAEGFHLWSEKYDRNLDDLFALQTDIARSIAGALQIELLTAPADLPASRAAHHPEAHALYLKGLFHRHRRTITDLQIARDCFQQAVELDPEFAQAHAALAFSHATSAHFHYDMTAPNEAYPLARAAVDKALALDDRIAEAHMVQGVLNAYFEWDWAAAERAFVRALALDPDNPYTLANYAIMGMLPGQVGKFVALSRRSEMLDPFWINAKTQVGIGLFVARRYAEAQQRFEQAAEMEPDWPISPLYLGDIHTIHKQFGRAEARYRQAERIIGRRPAILGRMGVLEAMRGRPAAAREVLAELDSLRRTHYVRPSYAADIHFQLGEKDEAYALMQRAIEERDTRLVILNLFPFYDALKPDPRFEALLRTVGLRPDDGA